MLSRIAISPARSVLVAQPARFAQTTASNNAAAEVAESPERDLVNFPRPVRSVEPAKVRLGFIPDDWFKFFYSKTGVTGPYVFGLGLTTYLCSKEIYVMEHEFYTGLSIAAMAIYAIKKTGPGVAAWLDKEVKQSDTELSAGREASVQEAKGSISSELVEQDRAKAQKMLFDAKRENVALQLEAAYRSHLLQVYTETKKRLDYQVEVQNVQRSMEQRHIVDWVIRNVRSAITPDQEKAALTQCISSLKTLAKNNTARL